MLSFHLISSVLVLSAWARLCDPVNHPYDDQQNVNASLSRTTFSTLGVFGVIPPPIEVSGTFSVVDGCSFAVSDFNFVPYLGSPFQYRWFGVRLSNSSQGILLSDAAVLPGRGQNLTYDLFSNQALGEPVSYEDFRAVHLFDINNNIIVARASLPQPNARSARNAASSSAHISLPGAQLFGLLALAALFLFSF
ncbi:MAG: hypothetical protein SGCHY_003722 [Lobulomycetales sp.]